MADEEFGPTRKVIYWMLAGVVITMVVLGFAIMLGNYRNNLTQTPKEVKAELVSLRFANIPECFAYEDPVNLRPYPGVIDVNKFTKEQMDKCYLTNPEMGYKDFNFGLELKGHNLKVITNNYYNQDSFTIVKNVLVKEKDGATTDDILYVYVQEIIGDPK
ncbi:hypothetical protein COY27_03700 [Candidatus Woesearchaeota archaeon CG_4_10_14_0_2_um_filter_33_13]|nr:MAG: hypothetical protein COY27_03700 [Candidatus Woesearchaeota archaeon CG_4_10_14_0_2_um_filter_33_13]